MKTLPIAFGVLLFAQTTFGQRVEPCGTTLLKKSILLKYPGLQRVLDSIEVNVQKRTKELNSSRLLFPGAPYRIQTVVHVLGTAADTIPTDAAIHAMIDSINKNLRGEDTDLPNLPSAFASVQAGNSGIQLCLTDIAPDASPTTGIVRTVTGTDNYFISYGTNWNQFMSAADPNAGGIAIWDRNRYLNILITPTLFDSANGGANGTNLGQRVGVSAFPGAPANVDCYVVLRPSMQSDGAHTHELGHWLNLRHIWGDDDGDTDTSNDCDGTDLVDDTPNQSVNSSGSGCTFPQLSCNNGPNGNMYMNYMDYSDCYMFFTAGQRNRMIATLQGPRSQLFGSNCQGTNLVLSSVLSGFYRTAGTIQSSGTVSNSLPCTLQSATKITLSPGFRSNAGTTAKISIKDCCTNQ